MDRATKAVDKDEPRGSEAVRGRWSAPRLRSIAAREAEVGPNNNATDGPLSHS